MAYNILIVDDSPAMRSFVHRVLDLSGLEIGRCTQAENGKAALDLLRGEWVDLILTDINMPEMNGLEFLQNMEADESLRMIPVVVVSTDKTENREQQMLELGAKGYVKKPFLPETLRAEIERVLEVNHGA
jgi:two-component system chemotaxis response regulator CheY